MPSETSGAVEFISPTPNGRILNIWDVQMGATEELVRICALSQSKWNARIPGSISADVGKFQTVVVKKLLRQLNVGGEAWLGQFAFGFPITGNLSQRFLFP